MGLSRHSRTFTADIGCPVQTVPSGLRHSVPKRLLAHSRALTYKLFSEGAGSYKVQPLPVGCLMQLLVDPGVQSPGPSPQPEPSLEDCASLTAPQASQTAFSRESCFPHCVRGVSQGESRRKLCVQISGSGSLSMCLKHGKFPNHT